MPCASSACKIYKLKPETKRVIPIRSPMYFVEPTLLKTGMSATKFFPAIHSYSMNAFLNFFETLLGLGTARFDVCSNFPSWNPRFSCDVGDGPIRHQTFARTEDPVRCHSS